MEIQPNNQTLPPQIPPQAKKWYQHKGLITIAVLIVLTALAIWLALNQKALKRGPRPLGNSASSFILNEVGYGCSKKIEGKWVEAWVGNPGSPGYNFQPSNQEDFKKYCRTNFVIEYQSVLDILRKDAVNNVIEKYSAAEAWVRALGHKYIHDKDYLNRILPAYSNIKIDCIIVVHSPEGTRFFIENGDRHDSHKDHQYLEVPATEFLSSLNNASDSDVNNFWLGLH